MKETLQIGGLDFEVRRSTRRKTLGLTVDRGGELVIHSPVATEDRELTRWTRSKLLWVHGKLALKEKQAPHIRQPEFVSGERFTYLGRSYRLQVVKELERPLHFDGRQFLLRKDAVPRALATKVFRSFRFCGPKPKAWKADLAGQFRLLNCTASNWISPDNLMGRSSTNTVANLENAVSLAIDEADECPPPPDAQRVARRALILSAIVCRSNIDHDPTNPDAIALWGRVKTWIESLDVAALIGLLMAIKCVCDI